MPLVLDLDGEALCVWRLCVKQGLLEVLCKRLDRLRKKWKVEKTAHVGATFYVSNLDKVASCAVANIGIYGEGTA